MFGYNYTSIPPSVPPMACYVVVFTFTLNKCHYACDPVNKREHVFFRSKQDYICLVFQWVTARLISCLTTITKKGRVCFQIVKTMIRSFDGVCYCCNVLQATSLLMYKFIEWFFEHVRRRQCACCNRWFVPFKLPILCNVQWQNNSVTFEWEVLRPV